MVRRAVPVREDNSLVAKAVASLIKNRMRACVLQLTRCSWKRTRSSRCSQTPSVTKFKMAYRTVLMSMRDLCISWCRSLRSALPSMEYNPCFRAFLLPCGAPDPSAPPCIRQRRLQPTAGLLQGFPERVLAPQRGLESIGPVLRGWLLLIILLFFYKPRGSW